MSSSACLSRALPPPLLWRVRRWGRARLLTTWRCRAECRRPPSGSAPHEGFEVGGHERPREPSPGYPTRGLVPRRLAIRTRETGSRGRGAGARCPTPTAAPCRAAGDGPARESRAGCRARLRTPPYARASRDPRTRKSGRDGPGEQPETRPPWDGAHAGRSRTRARKRRAGAGPGAARRSAVTRAGKPARRIVTRPRGRPRRPL